MFDPALDALSRTRLLNEHDTMQRGLDAFRLAKAEYDNPNGRKFDVNDDRDRDVADKIYLQQGATPAALQAVVSRTGILPDTARSTMLGDLVSGEPSRVERVVDRATRLNRDNPNLLAAEDGGEDLLNAVTQFRHEISRGAKPDQAIKRISELQSPEYQDAWAARRKNVDVDAEVAKAISPGDIYQAFGGDASATAMMFLGYRERAKERYLATGDLLLAKAQAIDQLKPVWRIIRDASDAATADEADRLEIPGAASEVGTTSPGKGSVKDSSVRNSVPDQAVETRASLNSRDPEEALRRYVEGLDARETSDIPYKGLDPQPNGNRTQAAEPLTWEQFDQSLAELPLKPHQQVVSFILRSYMKEIYENLKFVNDVMNGAYEAQPEVPGTWTELDEGRAIQLKEAEIRGTNRLALFAMSGGLTSLRTGAATLRMGPGWKTLGVIRHGQAAAIAENKTVQAVREVVPKYDEYLPKVRQIIEREKLNISETPGVVIYNQTGPIYRTFNQATRYDRTTLGQEIVLSQAVKGIEELASTLRNISRAPTRSAAEADMIWRQTQIGKSYDPGFQLQAYTLDTGVAVQWSKDAKLIYHIRDTNVGADVTKLSQYPRQREVLLPPGLDYTVADKRIVQFNKALIKVIELEVKNAK